MKTQLKKRLIFILLLLSSMNFYAQTQNKISDTSSFILVINELEKINFFKVKFNNWFSTYKFGYPSDYTNDMYFINASNKVWKGMDKERNIHEIVFEDVIITEVVVKQKTQEQWKPSVKITQIYFQNEEDIPEVLDKVKQISKYILSTRGLKNPNTYWHYNNSIYLFQTRAVAFEKDYYKIIERFKQEIIKLIISN